MSKCHIVGNLIHYWLIYQSRLYSMNSITSIFDVSVWEKTCLATDTFLTADPGVANSIPSRSHTFVEIDHEIVRFVPLPCVSLRKKKKNDNRNKMHILLKMLSWCIMRGFRKFCQRGSSLDSFFFC